MTINRVPVDPEYQAAFRAVIDVMPVIGWDFKLKESTGVQSRDQATDYPMWEVAVAVKPAEDRKAETIYVRVPHPTRPEVEGQRVVFGGLEFGAAAYGNDDGSATLTLRWTARTVGVMPPAPASRRAEAASDNAKTPATASA